MRMRTITQAAEEMKVVDPNSAITKTALRRLVISGAIPSTRVGTKYLIDLDSVEAYFATQRSPAAPLAQTGVVRPIVE